MRELVADDGHGDAFGGELSGVSLSCVRRAGTCPRPRPPGPPASARPATGEALPWSCRPHQRRPCWPQHPAQIPRRKQPLPQRVLQAGDNGLLGMRRPAATLHCGTQPKLTVSPRSGPAGAGWLRSLGTQAVLEQRGTRRGGRSQGRFGSARARRSSHRERLRRGAAGRRPAATTPSTPSRVRRPGTTGLSRPRRSCSSRRQP